MKKTLLFPINAIKLHYDALLDQRQKDVIAKKTDITEKV